MNKKIPKVFVNNIKKINNNKVVFYSSKENFDEEEIIKMPNIVEINNKINDLFKANDFIYKKRFLIRTIEKEEIYTVISRSYDYLLTMDGNRIYIKDIVDIKSA